MKIGIYDHASGEQIERDMTADELAQFQATIQANEEAEQARLLEEAEKLAKKAELLAKLGITEDDAKLLLS